MRSPIGWHLRRGSPTLTWLFIAMFCVPMALARVTPAWRVVFAVAGIWALGGLIVSFRSQWVMLDQQGLEFRDGRRRRAVLWADVAAVSFGHQPLTPPRSMASVALHLRPGRKRTYESTPPVPSDVLPDVRAVISRSGFDIPINPTPPWRDRWGNWHGPMFEREPREAIRSVHEAYVGPWRIRVRRIGAEYQALLEMTVGNTRVREGEPRQSLREATDDGSRFVLDAQTTLAEGDDLVP